MSNNVDSAANINITVGSNTVVTKEILNEYAALGRVVGDYCLFETIGNGSFGKVRRGVHIPTKQRVAVKMLNRQALASGNMDTKIRREIKILKLFNHAHICRLYDVLYTPGDIFVVMEYCGKELYDHIVRFGKLDEPQARHIFQQIVCALEYCHHFRVVHRDLKPENILYSAETRTAKLIDFGLANIMQDGEFLRTSCGSPNYAAPEVISGKLYAGPEVDVWSCGVVLYALLCGCLPFDEDSIPALFAKIKRGTYNIPSHVSPEAADLLRQILAVDPVLRITISQVRDHAWFALRLPKHLYYRPSLFFSVAHVDEEIVEQVYQLLNSEAEAAGNSSGRVATTHREIREAVAKWSAPSASKDGSGGCVDAGVIVAPRQAVVYSILLDAERQRQILSDSNRPDDDATSASSTAGGGVSASQAELNHGLVLSVSPAIELLLDKQDAATNKRAYNSTQFLPRSAHDLVAKGACVDAGGAGGGAGSGSSYSAMMLAGGLGGGASGGGGIGKSPGGFAFSAKALGSGPSSFSERVGSFQQARSLGGGCMSGSLPGAPPPSLRSPQALTMAPTGTAAPSSGSQSLVGVVARTNTVYTADEELFHVQNNTGWRVGLMTDKRSVDTVAQLCSILVSKNLEWKVVAPYLLIVRRKGCSVTLPSTTVIQIHLLRVQERHDRGFIVDFAHVRGGIMASLELTIEISRELTRRIG